MNIKTSVEIEIKKIVARDGNESYLIKKITGCFTKENLPQEYLKGTYFHWVTVGIIIQNYLGDPLYLFEGEIYSRQEFQNRFSLMRECGERLSKIRKEIAEKQKNWVGYYTFVM